MDTQRPTDTNVDGPAPGLLPWSAPALEQLDIEKTAKGSDTFENSLAYSSPPVC